MTTPGNESDTSFSRRQRARIGRNVLVSVVTLAAVLVMANYIAAKHFRRFHWTPDDRYELSPLTLRLLKSLTNEVQVTIFYDRDEVLYSPVSGLLREYAETSPRIRLKTVDYVRRPDEALQVKTRHGLTSPDNNDMVIFESNGRTKLVHRGDLSDYEQTGEVVDGKPEFKRSAFLGEMLFTSAILSVSDPNPPKAYFLTGHGEHSADELGDEGCSEFGKVLRESNVDSAELFLRGTNDVPADCDLLIILGSRRPYLPWERERIERYLRQGGRLLAALNVFSVTNPTGLEEILRQWNVDIGANVVLETNEKYTLKGADLFAVGIVPHPITKALLDLQLVPWFVSPRTVKPGSARTPDGVRVEELIKSSESAVTVSRFNTNGMPVHLDGDPRGSVSLVVAVEKGHIEGVSADRGITRMVVAGDSSFLINSRINQMGNRDLASAAVNWLLDRSLLLAGLGPRPLKRYSVEVSRGDLRSIRWILVGGIPGGILAAGFIVWLRRRV